MKVPGVLVIILLSLASFFHMVGEAGCLFGGRRGDRDVASGLSFSLHVSGCRDALVTQPAFPVALPSHPGYSQIVSGQDREHPS